jgi:hypothetical protein
MAVQIVEDVPGRGGARQAGRGAARLLGGLLFVIGAVAALVPVAAVVALVVDLFSHDSPSVDNGAWTLFVVATAVMFVGLAGGLRLIRGRRRLGLYLRKFGFAGTTSTVSHALSRSVGRSWRLVTLDDSMVAPVGAGRVRRRGAFLVLLLAVVVLGYLGFYLWGGAFNRDQAQIFTSTNSQADSIAEVVVDSLAGAAVLAVLLTFILIAATIALVIAVFGAAAYLAARRAERGATRALTRQQGVDEAARRIARAARRIFAARLVVVRVPGEFWQRAVSALAAVSAVVVIDVSHPTENLLWEVQTVRPLFSGRWVLVGARDLVRSLQQPGSGPAAQLAQLLDGERILAYGPDPADRKRFARALRRALDQT